MKKIIICALSAVFACLLITAAYAAEAAYYSFDGDYGDATPIKRQEYYSDAGLVEGDGSTFRYSEGMLGKCLYMSGGETLKLNVNMTAESYTAAFWIKPDIITNCTPSIIITPSGFEAEKFINLTLATFDGLSPNIWTHMMEPYDERNNTGVSGMLRANEWTHITMVVDENMPEEILSEYNVSTDEYTSGVKLYINGFLVSAGRVPKQICTGSSSYWFGVNIWDDLFKGCVDELYLYSEALDDAAVKELYLASGGDEDAKNPLDNAITNNMQNNDRPPRPNGGSISDDYIHNEQDMPNSFLNPDNSAPVATQGTETTTNSYADAARLLAFALLLLSAAMLLQYIKQKKNSYG